MWNVASDVSPSATAARSTTASLQMDLASAGILLAAMSSKAFKWGTMPSKAEMSVDAKHSRVMYLTKALCSNVHCCGVNVACCKWTLKMRTQSSTVSGCARSALTQRFVLIACMAL